MTHAGLAADELVVNRSSRHVHARRSDVCASVSTARRRHPSRPGAVHPGPPGWCAWPVSSTLQPCRLVVCAVCCSWAPGLPSRRGLYQRSNCAWKQGPFSACSDGWPGAVPSLFLCRRVRYVRSQQLLHANAPYNIGRQVWLLQLMPNSHLRRRVVDVNWPLAFFVKKTSEYFHDC